MEIFVKKLGVINKKGNKFPVKICKFWPTFSIFHIRQVSTLSSANKEEKLMVGPENLSTWQVSTLDRVHNSRFDCNSIPYWHTDIRTEQRFI